MSEKSEKKVSSIGNQDPLTQVSAEIRQVELTILVLKALIADRERYLEYVKAEQLRIAHIAKDESEGGDDVEI